MFLKNRRNEAFYKIFTQRGFLNEAFYKIFTQRGFLYVREDVDFLLNNGYDLDSLFKDFDFSDNCLTVVLAYQTMLNKN